jgi:prepilin-type N-terminal cleavage/methylation domain-containing protein
MKQRRAHGASGFTLIELLVVIAIISILAAIVVPNVTDWISRANMAKAVSEVQGIDLALTKVLTDAGVNSASQLFDNNTLWRMQQGDLQYNSNVLYELLRQGRNGDLGEGGKPGIGLKEEVKARLGTFYMDVPSDPWDQLYTWYPGPWRRVPDYAGSYNAWEDVVNASSGGSLDTLPVVLLRSWRQNPNSAEDDRFEPEYEPFYYTQKEMPGDPPPRQLGGSNLPGFPAPVDASFYVWSLGKNLESDQELHRFDPAGFPPTNTYVGGGDDINNWDKNSGWQGFYG